MGIIVLNLFISLDGVYQAPGGVDEDREGGFEYGGWQAPFFDEESGAAIGADIGKIDALLLGRKTYDIWAGYWPNVPQDNPIAARFNTAPKYLASRTITEPSWEHTTVLNDATSQVGALRERYEQTHITGSGGLARSLLTANLIDRMNLWLYPVAFGSGKRLFGDGVVPASFTLVQPPQAFPKGAVSLVYERAGEVETRDIEE